MKVFLKMVGTFIDNFKSQNKLSICYFVALAFLNKDGTLDNHRDGEKEINGGYDFIT